MSLLVQEPDAPVATLDDLLGVAVAMESEAVRLYVRLEAEMSRQGVDDVATVFRRLVAMEQRHVGAVAAFGQEVLGHAVLPFPPGEASVWSKVVMPAVGEAASTVLTPYRALSIAVRTEERAFAFYSYIAAEASAPSVRRHAEALATEELQHAAQLRAERRRAYHRDPDRRGISIPDSPEALAILASELQAEVTRSIAALSGEGEDKRSQWERVRLLERLYETYNTIVERTGSESVMTEALSLAEKVLSDLALARQRLITAKPTPAEAPRADTTIRSR